MGKTGRKKEYSAEFKIGVIIDMREHHLGYGETVRKYWDIMKGQEQNYKNTIIRWERIYLEEGAEGLMKEDEAEFVPPVRQEKADRLN